MAIKVNNHAAPPRRPSLIRAAVAIAWKDLRTELRSKEMDTAMGVFALLAIMLFSFALEFDREGREAAAGGVLWVTLIFAGTLGLGASLGREKDQGKSKKILQLNNFFSPKAKRDRFVCR